MCAKSLQSCLTLCDLTDCSPPGSSLHGILQEEILEWVAMASPPPGDLWDPGIERTSPCLLHWQMGSLPLVPPGKPAVPLNRTYFIDFYDHFPLILLHLIVSYMKKKKRHKKDEWKAISKLSGKDMLLLFFY